MEIFTSPDYDEVHHKMLECYFIQPLKMEPHDKTSIEIKPKGIIGNYLIQPLPKGTSNRRSTNGTQSNETKGSIQLLPRGINYHKKVPHEQQLEDSTPLTLYNYCTTTSIKDNAHVKYKTTANVSNHKPANILTIIWLQHVCKNWYLMLIALLTQNWYSPQWNSSIHSSINLPQIINTDLQQENQQAFTTRLKIQPHFKGFQDIKPETFGLLSKSQGKFNLDFIDGDHSRLISRKKKTLHKTISSLMFSDTKKIPQVRTITCIPKIKTHSGDELCTHFQLNKSTQNQVTSNDDYEKSWTNNLRSRSLTKPTNLIIISYMLRLLEPRSPESSLPSSSELQRVLVVLSSSQFQGPFVLLCSSEFQRILVLFPRSEFRTVSALQFQVFSIWLSSSRFQTDLVLISGYQLKPTQRVNRSCNKMGATSREKGKLAMTRSVDDIVFSTEMSALDFEPSRQEETFLQLTGLDRFVTRVTWEMLNIPVVREVITNLNLHTMESVLNGQVFPIFSKDWRNQMGMVFYLTTFSAKREPGTPKVAATDIFPNFGKGRRAKQEPAKSRSALFQKQKDH